MKGLFAKIENAVRQHPYWYGTVLVLLILSFIIRAPKPHVALGGEAISIHGPSWLTNSLLTTFIVDLILIGVALATRFGMKLIPSGLQNFMEFTIESMYNLAEGVAGKAVRTYFPISMTLFLLIIVSNWTGLIPGVGSIGFEQHHGAETESHSSLDRQLAMSNGALILTSSQAETAAGEAEAGHFVPLFRAPSADLNLTLALALTTMGLVQYFGVRTLGGGYFRKFFNASGKGFMRGINAFVGILELVSEISRILSFSFRLFGNIFAGEIVLATMAFLVTFMIPVPFYVLELFVGFVQALVFMMLSLVFFSMATIGHHDDHGEEHHADGHAVEAAAVPAH